jgi:hypothetical protein
VNGQFEAPHSNGAVAVQEPDGAAPERTKSRRRRRTILLALLVLVCIAWGYAIWYSVTRTSPEDLDDTAAAQVRDACTAALEQLEALPAFSSEFTAADDVDLVRQENEIFEAMVATTDAVEPTNADAATALDKWNDDWRSLIQARSEFADDLAGDGTARLRTPAVRSGSLQPISERMNDYARQQGLLVCQPDALQAEAVDGVRDYSTVEN